MIASVKRFWLLGLAALAVVLLISSAAAAQETTPRPYLQPRGAEITYVRPGGPAYRAGLEVGDIIVEVNRHRIQSIPDLRHALQTAGYRARMTVINWRNGEHVALFVYPSGGKIGIDARMTDLSWPRPIERPGL